MVSEAESVGAFLPGFRHVLLYDPHHLLVFQVSSALVPESEHHAGALFGCLHGEIHHLLHVACQFAPGITFVRMQRELDFMGQGIEQRQASMEQGSIGCEHRLESLFVCHPHKLRQQRMEQRLAHQVEIEKAHLAPHLIRDEIELLCTQLSLPAMMLRAEIAIQIAGIGYFDVTAVYHIFYFIFFYILINFI